MRWSGFDKPNRHEVKARIDDETLRILGECYEQKGIGKAEDMRDGISQLRADLEKKQMKRHTLSTKNRRV